MLLGILVLVERRVLQDRRESADGLGYLEGLVHSAREVGNQAITQTDQS